LTPARSGGLACAPLPRMLRGPCMVRCSVAAHWRKILKI
jgi:hypothetical protein